MDLVFKDTNIYGDKNKSLVLSKIEVRLVVTGVGGWWLCSWGLLLSVGNSACCNGLRLHECVGAVGARFVFGIENVQIERFIVNDFAGIFLFAGFSFH